MAGKTVCCMFPYGEANNVFAQIKTALGGNETAITFSPERVPGDVAISGWMATLEAQIHDAAYVIVDITGQQKCEFFELGFAGSIDLDKVILISQDQLQLAPTIPGLLCIEYDDADYSVFRRDLKNTILTREIERSDSWYEKGVIAKDLERSSEAADYFSRAIEEDPEDAGAFFMRGTLHRKSGQYREAYDDFSRSLEIKPDYKGAHFFRGLVCKSMGRFPEAIEDLTRMLRVEGPWGAAYRERAFVYISMKHFELALNDYKQAIACDPTDVKSLIVSSLLNCRVGDLECARRHSVSAVSLDPENAEAYYSLGFYYNTVRMPDKAIMCFNAAIEYGGGDGEVRNQRGGAFLDTGQYEQAESDFAQALTMSPDNAGYWFNRGLARCYLKRLSEGVEDFSRALELSPEYTSALYNRGLALSRLQMKERAMEDLKAVLKLQPDHQAALQLTKKLLADNNNDT